MHEMAVAGEDPGRIARVLGRPRAEVVIRLVELELGPLGRVRPLAAERTAGRGNPFADVAVPAATRSVVERQAPILRLAARAFGGSLQKLGDRLFLDGAETDLPTVVGRARGCGVPIRYPGIDPMGSAFAGGPSARPRRRKRAGAAFGGLWP